MWDIMLWLAWANANRASKSVWTHVGHQMWPKLDWFAGAMLEAHALSLCKLCPDPLPVLKTKHGFSKRASVTKKIILFNKTEKEETTTICNGNT